MSAGIVQPADWPDGQAVGMSGAQVVPVKSPALAHRLATIAQTGLFLLAVVYTLVFGAPVLIPIVVAILLNLLLSPLVRVASRYGVPRGFSAALILAGIMLVVGSAVVSLAGPAETWLSESPRNMRQLRARLLPVERSLDDIKAVADQVDELTGMAGKADSRPIKVDEQGTLESLIGGVPRVIGYLGIMLFLTYFLLASGDRLMRKIVLLGPTWAARRRMVMIARRIQTDISRYLATITAINIALGACVALAMLLLDVPNPMLWGVMAATLNFAPYVGAAVSALVLTVVGITTFGSMSDALTVPAVFILLTVLEGQLLTPLVVGRSLSLSPTAVFVSVVLWVFLWGVVGALIAVPIVASLKVFCENVLPLNPVADLLGE